MKRNRLHPRGETLLEGMVALAIFTVGMLGVLSSSVLANKQNGLASHEGRAANVARDLIDALERLPYKHPALDTGRTHRLADSENTGDGVNRPLLGAAGEIVGADGNGNGTTGTYQVSWTTAVDNDASGVESGKVITITVIYSSGGLSKSLTFYSYKYNPSAVVGQTAKVEEI